MRPLTVGAFGHGGSARKHLRRPTPLAPGADRGGPSRWKGMLWRRWPGTVTGKATVGRAQEVYTYYAEEPMPCRGQNGWLGRLGSAVERLDGGAPDADAGVGEPVVDAGEGHAGHVDQGRLLDLRRVCPARGGQRGRAKGAVEGRCAEQASARRVGPCLLVVARVGRELRRTGVSHGLSKCWTSQSSRMDSASELRWPFFLLLNCGQFRQFTSLES